MFQTSSMKQAKLLPFLNQLSSWQIDVLQDPWFNTKYDLVIDKHLGDNNERFTSTKGYPLLICKKAIKCIFK